MTQPQDQPNTRGQCLDYNPDGTDYGAWPGVLQKSTFTLSVYAAGTYSFEIDGTIVTYTAVGGDDAITTTAGLLADFQAKKAAQRSAKAFVETASQTVLRLQARSPDDSYTITNVAVPGGATWTFADATTLRDRLGLGLGVAFVDDDPESLRELGSGDTGATVVGVTVEGYEVAPNSGDPADEDGYDPGSPVTYVHHGRVVVPVETDITSLNDPVYVRIIATGDEEAGAWRNDADGGDAVLVSNARWTLLSYLDNQSRKTAELRVNFV
jgi:hypothetical protein